MNDEISNNQLFKSFWIYCLNHSRVRYDGEIEINFVIENRGDFIQKVRSRLGGKYGIVNATEVYNESLRIKELYEAHKKMRKFYKKRFWEILLVKLANMITKKIYPLKFKIDYPYMQFKKFGINPLKSKIEKT